MIKKLAAVFLAVVTIVLIAGGCNSNIIESVDSLMVPPVFYEEYEDLVAAFKGAVGENISFCPPVSGDYRSAIIFNDMDGDGQGEALVFYRLSDSHNSVRMHYLDLLDERWVSVADFAGYGVGVESVNFEDFNASEFDELLVTWSIYPGSASKILSVYKNVEESGNSAITELTNITFNVMLTADADSDGCKEIFYIEQSTSAGGSQRSAKLLKIKDKSVVVAGETKLDGNVSGYVSIKTEKGSANMPFRIYADALKGESQMITEVVYWDKKTSNLAAPLLDSETLTNSATLRNELITSRDINNDGIIDIPTQPAVGASAAAAGADIDGGSYVQLTEWININGDKTETVVYSYVNCKQDYMITLSGSEAAELSVRKDKTLNNWVFYTRGDDATQETVLFTLAFVSNGEDNQRYSGYPIIMTSAAGLIYSIPGDENDTLQIDPAERISGFSAQTNINEGV